LKTCSSLKYSFIYSKIKESQENLALSLYNNIGLAFFSRLGDTQAMGLKNMQEKLE
jgi:CRISPR/Cas system endoribonuclease Cas6 (RAMP superfamily)